MRSHYTCLSCLLQQSRQLPAPHPFPSTRVFSSCVGASPKWTAHNSPLDRDHQRSRIPIPEAFCRKVSTQTVSHQRRENAKRPSRVRRHYSSGSADVAPFKLTSMSEKYVTALSRLRSRLNYCVYSSSSDDKNDRAQMTIEQALAISGASLPDTLDDGKAEYQQVATLLGEHFAGEKYATVKPRIDQIMTWKTFPAAKRDAMLRENPSLASATVALGLVLLEEAAQPVNIDTPSNESRGEATADLPVRTVKSPSEDDADIPSGSFKPLNITDQALEPVYTGTIEVPKLSFDLSRVLFNPGVYQLQDPGSRVYNFDPYLEKIMPVTDFNFEALNKYITSSEDNVLRDLAVKRQRRYIGSSSSMTSTLAHFHFLLSSWRSLNVDILSRGFRAESDNFTRFQRAPTAIFLRKQNGVYAMDADKEYDDATVLLSLGRSMEKLLTLEKNDFERLRKSNAIESGQFDLAPEQYHYSELGSFLMRSQLDAHDPRLPGTGMFDLKTRAVVAVRMTMADQRGTGYEIKHRYGTWESFEREYYDMMRSAFLKYSLQVRMGRMDGVFVAFHNIERIFGFQYISLAEMDKALHGQADRKLGDEEFRFSVKLLTEVFDLATRTFPNQSLRFHFETRESSATKSEAKPWMYVFAEPVSEEEIEKIQASRSKEVKEAEERILGGKAGLRREGSVIKPDTNAGDAEFLDSLDELRIENDSAATASQPPKVPVLGMKVAVQNRVNGKKTMRPIDLTETDKWEMDYSITEMPKSQAETRYSQCKTRRSLMFGSTRDVDVTADGYISRLIDMSEAGTAWRKERDEMDAAKERVVLYDARTDEMGPGTNS